MEIATSKQYNIVFQFCQFASTQDVILLGHHDSLVSKGAAYHAEGGGFDSRIFFFELHTMVKALETSQLITGAVLEENVPVGT